MVDLNTRRTAAKKESEQVRLLEAIDKESIDSVSALAKPEFIQPKHLLLAKKKHIEACTEQDSLGVLSLYGIMQKLLHNASIDTLTEFSDKAAGVATTVLNSLADDARHEIIRRKLSEAIVSENVDMIGFLIKTATMPLVDKNHLSLAGKKHEEEISSDGNGGIIRGTSTRVFELLIKKSAPSVLKEYKDEKELGYSSKILVENELKRREKVHPLDQIMNGTYSLGNSR